MPATSSGSCSCGRAVSTAAHSGAGQGGAPQTVRLYGKAPQRGPAPEGEPGATTIEGKADRILDLVRELSVKLNAGLKLPDIPIASSGGLPSLGPNQERIIQIMGRAEEELDRGNIEYAKTLMRNVLALNKNYELAQTRLASLEKMSK